MRAADRKPEGAWFGRSPDHYSTRGAECIHGDGGWYVRVGRRVRGPLSCLPIAMEAADRMLADDIARSAAPPLQREAA